MVVNKWNPDVAEMIEAGLGELVYRSNLIGSDRAVCNWGGGNTSMKTREVDFRGEEIDVLWVKGSGSDLASMKKENFTALKLQEKRLDVAAKMLEQTNIPVGVISEEVGYMNFSYFYKIFKKRFSRTPLNYRKEMSLQG